MGRVTLRDIARKSNLSHTTVSLVLNDRADAGIPAKTRERVVDAARELGYRPNRAARALVTGRTNMIALLVPRISSAFYTKVIDNLQGRVRQDGFEVIVGAVPEGDPWRKNHSLVTDWAVDGVLVYDCPWWTAAYQDGNVGPDHAVVTMGAYYDPSPDAHVVGIDLYPASVAAVEHLQSSGRRRVVHLTSNADVCDARSRAYADVMRGAGLEPEYIHVSDDVCASGQAGVRDYVTAHGCPDAIFCRNDDLAVGAHRALTDVGRHVPTDVALVGCDGIEYAEYHVPSLSTIVKPLADVCAQGWELLRRGMEEPGMLQQQIILPASLVIRESSMNR